MLLYGLFTLLLAQLWGSVCEDLYQPRKFSKLLWPLPIQIFAVLSDFTHLPIVDATIMTATTNDGLAVFYEVTIALWFAVLLDHLAHDEGDKDRQIMLIHHLCTLTALFASCYGGYRRVGTVVLLLHDAVDVPLTILKISVKTKQSEFVCALTYVLTVATWFVCRNVLFSGLLYMYVIPASQEQQTTSLYIATLCLCVLWVCNCIWTVMLLRVPFKNKIRDAEKDYEGQQVA